MRDDYPIHEVIAMWQDRILDQLLSPLTLQRLYDSELRVPADQDAFTTAELMHRPDDGRCLPKSKKCRPPASTPTASRRSAASAAICSGIYLKRDSQLAMGDQRCSGRLPDRRLRGVEGRWQGRIDKLLAGKSSSTTTAATTCRKPSHRIAKVLDARLQLKAP